jgi:hypothetical protein
MEKSNTNKQFLLTNKNLIKFYIYPLLENKEIIKFSKINSSFFQAFKIYVQDWQNELNILAAKFDLDIKNDSFKNLNRLQAFHKGVGYKINETKSNYIQFIPDGYRHFALGIGEYWAHQDNQNYWKKTFFENNSFGNETYQLIDVCWIDPCFRLQKVKTDSYDIYIRQAIKKTSNINNSMILRLIVLDGVQEIEIYKQHFLDNNMKKDLIQELYQNSTKTTPEKLVDSFLVSIDLRKFTKAGECTVLIKFFQDNGNWKSGWYIDGVFLEKHDGVSLEKQDNYDK